MNEEDFIPIPARVALLQKLGQPVAPLPTDEAARALKILQSLQDNPPQNARARRKVIKNPVTRTQGSMIPLLVDILSSLRTWILGTPDLKTKSRLIL